MIEDTHTTPKQQLDLTFDTETTALKRTNCRQYIRNPKVIVGVSVGALLALSLGLSLFRSTPQAEVYEPESSVELDKAAIVAESQNAHAHIAFQSTAQLDDFEYQLLSQEAHRYWLEAQSQVKDSTKPCFGQSVFCVFDQFQQDAVTQIEQARDSRDWQAMLSALDRVDAMELARQSVMPTEPEVNLSQLAIDNLIQSHQRVRGASAEAKAWEVQQHD